MVMGKLKVKFNSTRNLREIIPQSQLCLVYLALVENHLRCGNLMWGQLPEEKLCSLQKIQSRACYFTESTPSKDLIPLAHKMIRRVSHMTRPRWHTRFLGRHPENLKGQCTNRTLASNCEAHRMNDLQIPRPWWGAQKRFS